MTEMIFMELQQIEFNKLVHLEAKAFRRKKIMEFLAKPESEQDDLSYSVIKLWCKHYGEETY